MGKNFEKLLAGVAGKEMKTVAVAVAEDELVLQAVSAARDLGIATAVLVGDADRIVELAGENGIDLRGFALIHQPDHEAATLRAVELVHNGQADMYMKGLVDSKTFLRSVLNKEVGLRTGRQLSHVAVFDIEGYDRLFFLTDSAFNTYPTLEEKAAIIRNAVEVARACGVECPKVAPLAAIETVNPKMPATGDGAELTRMNEDGRITGCIVDGPLSLDLAIDPGAAKHKAAEDRKIVGDADILLFPDIQAGNIAYKCLAKTAKSQNGGILVGTSAPVIMTSRSDTVEVKVNSIALAAAVSEAARKISREEQ